MFRFARYSLANRAVVALATIAIALFGVVSLGTLKQELIPSLQFPAAGVVGIYPGASPQVVDQQVTQVMETAVRGVRGVEDVTSTSSTSMSVSMVSFKYGTDMDAAAQQLQSALTRVQSRLPGGVEPQVVTGSVDDLPVVQLAVSGGSDEAALADEVNKVLVPRLEKLTGVATVTVSGVADQQVMVTLNPAAMAAAGVDAQQISTVLTSNGAVLPAGTVTEGDTTLSVQVGSQITSVDELKALPLISGTGAPTTLGAVATVTAGPAPVTSYSRLDGEPSLSIAVTKSPSGNTVEVSHEVRDAVKEASESLGDARVEVVFDQAPFIEQSIEDLSTEGLLGLLFAVVVILLFLTSVRSTLVSAISIPLSLCVTFGVMSVSGYSLNILTLGAMTIAIGRVVDDSIVVIENIKRHLSYGEAKKDAILTAIREVGGAITASTVCTVAVFLPITFVGGFVGELFRPFAMTVTIAMLASLFVALTIVPVLAYWFIKAPVDYDEQAASAAREAAEAKERRGLWQRAYIPTLSTALRRPVVTLVIAVVILGGTLALGGRLQTNFLGDSGQNTLTVTDTFNPGTSLAAQDKAARDVEKVLDGVDGVETVLSTVGTGSGAEAAFMAGVTPKATFSVTLKESADATVLQTEIRDALKDVKSSQSTGITVSGGDSGFGSSTVDLVVRADDPDALKKAAEIVQKAAESTEGAAEVNNNLASDQQVVEVKVDRAAAAARGLTEAQVSGVVAAAMSPYSIGTVDLGAGPVQVKVSAGAAPATVDELKAMAVPSPAGMVPLPSIAAISEVAIPTSVTRVDGQQSATVAVTPEGQDLGSLTASLTTAVDELDLPAGASVEVGGVAAQQSDAFADLGLALLAAIAIVYLVMVGTFRSLMQPLILLVSVPFAATGALLMLVLTSTPLGVPSLIGMLMLVGIVVSNAIVLIDLINQYRAQGRSLDDAVAEGSRKRLRPIVMTAAATIFALTPMAFGLTGGGGFIAQPLALVVIGGLISSTFLTLVVVPVLYVLFERAKLRMSDRRAARRSGRAAKKVLAGPKGAQVAVAGAAAGEATTVTEKVTSPAAGGAAEKPGEEAADGTAEKPGGKHTS